LFGCEKGEEGVTTESIKGTVWVNAVYNFGLTNVDVLFFTSNDEGEMLFAGSTVNSDAVKFNFKVEDNKIIITTNNATFVCTVKKDELLMYTKNPITGLEENPAKYKKV